MDKRLVIKFLLSAIFIFVLDQLIKMIILNGFRASGEFISIVLVFNKGVAFSMFSFLEENVKLLQITALILFFGYLFYEKHFLKKYTTVFGAIFGSGVSNITDRFMHPGVVDYIFWHKWFEFAIFNMADAVINLGIFIILTTEILQKIKKTH